MLRTALSLILVAALAGCAVHSHLKSKAAHYRLPFGPETSSELLQGYAGPYGHEGKIEFAYDFKMPIGTNVAAARDGVVVKTESKFEDNTKVPGEENYIFIAHGDKTFSRYYHLTKGGVLVREGQHVHAGQVIGKSGNSGATAGPHLHFDVTVD